MASIPSLVRPAAIPKPLPYALRPSMRPGSGSSGREASVPSPPMPQREVMARRIIDGVKGIGDQKELADGVVRFLAANYRHGRKRRQGSSDMVVAQAALAGIMAADSGDCLPAP
jgi:hypothetical protein